MTVTVASFRQDYPEFASPIKYTDRDIQRYLVLGVNRCDPARWGDIADLGVSLFTAHFLVLAARDKARSDAGGIPGQVVGPQGSKSVGGVSASYDTASVTEQGAGFWNMTTYGIEFYRWSNMAGMGPLTIF